MRAAQIVALAIIGLTACHSTAPTEDTHDPIGRWASSVTLGQADLLLVVEFRRDGTYTDSIAVPGQAFLRWTTGRWTREGNTMTSRGVVCLESTGPVQCPGQTNDDLAKIIDDTWEIAGIMDGEFKTITLIRIKKL